MNKLLATAVVWMLICGAAAAANNAPASDASIREMLELTNSRQMLDSVKAQMTGMMNTTMKPVQEKIMVIQRESIQELKDLKDKEDAKK
jgi:hypothetical protein